LYKIIDVKNKIWKQIIELYQLDIYFYPEYLKIWEDYGDGEVQAFLYESELGKVFYTYLIREIPFDNKNENYYDITTPYGYGGPLILDCKTNNKFLLLAEFRNAFNQYAKEEGIISEFIRFHPLIKNHVLFVDQDIECEFNRNTVFIDLDNSRDADKALLMNMKPQTRNKVRQTLKNGINIIFKTEPSLEDIKNFISLYKLTMGRLNAPEYYFFSLEYFLNCFTLLKNNIELAFVKMEDQIISASIFLFSKKMAHYHLSGYLSEYNKYRPNNFLLYSAGLRYGEMGKKYFHLGGGYRGNDSLYSFKKGFNKNGILDFYIGKKIHNIEIYNLIVEKWKIENNLDSSFTSDYFPLYRYR